MNNIELNNHNSEKSAYLAGKSVHIKSDERTLTSFENNFLKLCYLRGYFDLNGSIKVNDGVVTCSIYVDSNSFMKELDTFIKVSHTINENNIIFIGNNSLDFLDLIYKDSIFRLESKYAEYISISKYISPNTVCQWVKSRPDAKEPSKERASDSGYDLVLLERIKTVGNIEFYDTGIKVSPPFGYYFDLIPRSSISKTGYILANSIGVIDRTYQGNIIVPLIKIDQSLPDIKLPIRLVQIVPRQIVHFQFEELNEFKEYTARGENGFGSSNN